MTTPESDDQRPSEKRPLDDGEVDAAFASIVSGISGRMAWDVDPAELDDSADRLAAERSPAPDPRPDPAVDADARRDSADDRRRRRDERRAARADEYAEYVAAEAERQNELLFDDEHFVPPEPPPLERPKARTVWAFVLIFAGVFLMVGPNFLAISGDATLILGVLMVVGGFVLLMMGLRQHRGEPGEGWDDGSQP